MATKRISLTTAELQWIESALLKNMTQITKDLNNVPKDTPAWHLLQLQFSNLEALKDRLNKSRWGVLAK